MAERRMFAKSIVLSDAFLDMPLGARCLYMTMGMLADDDGFVNSPKSIIRQCGATVDDMNVLIAKKFVIPFESGVIVIKHWRINNYLRNDRYQPTTYLDEKAHLTVDENGAYKADNTVGIPISVYPDKDSIGKYRIGKDKSIGTKSKRFVPPTLEEVTTYVSERGNKIDPQKFYDYYTAADWKDSKGQQVRNWKQKCITWESHRTEKTFPDFENKTEKKETPTMTPEEAKEYYENLIEELKNGQQGNL